MSFAPTLAAIIGGLLLGFVLVNTCVEWGRAVWAAVRSHPRDSWTKTLCRAGIVSIQSKGPWVLGAVIVIALLLPREPWAKGILVAGISWIAFVLVTLLIAVMATVLYSASARTRARQNRHP